MPALKLSFNFTDSVVDLVREGYDMAVRIGEQLAPDYVAIPLYPNRHVVCGPPAYFARHGTPQTPEDLALHNCLAFAGGGFNIQVRHLSEMILDLTPMVLFIDLTPMVLFSSRVAHRSMCNEGKVAPEAKVADRADIELARAQMFEREMKRANPNWHGRYTSGRSSSY